MVNTFINMSKNSIYHLTHFFCTTPHRSQIRVVCSRFPYEWHTLRTPIFGFSTSPTKQCRNSLQSLGWRQLSTRFPFPLLIPQYRPSFWLSHPSATRLKMLQSWLLPWFSTKLAHFLHSLLSQSYSFVQMYLVLSPILWSDLSCSSEQPRAPIVSFWVNHLLPNCWLVLCTLIGSLPKVDDVSDPKCCNLWWLFRIWWKTGQDFPRVPDVLFATVPSPS